MDNLCQIQNPEKIGSQTVLLLPILPSNPNTPIQEQTSTVPKEPALLMLQAESFRKNGNLAKAVEILEELWQINPSPDTAWRKSWCLRKLKNYIKAKEVIDETEKLFPDNMMIKNEKFWLIYEMELKPAKETKNHLRLLEVAETIYRTDLEKLQLNVLAFMAISAAKELGRYDLVSIWCDRIPLADINPNPRVVAGRKLCSDLEIWYFSKVKALLVLEKFSEARKIALDAAKKFPARIDFYRWAALALAKSGNKAEALKEIEMLTFKRKGPWYIFADQAALEFETGNLEKAWQTAVMAAKIQGDSKSKVNLFQLMADIAIRLNKPDDAAIHTALSIAIRKENGWKIPQPLVDLQIELKIQHNLPPSSELLSKCKKIWMSGEKTELDSAIPAPNERQTGKVKFFNLITGNGFIKRDSDGKDIFVQETDIPPNCRKQGIAVSFVTVPDFNHKKQCQSERAVQVLPLAA